MPTSSCAYPNGTPLPLMMPDFEEHDDGDALYLSVASFNPLVDVDVRPHDKRTGGIQPFAAFEWISEADSKDVLEIESRGPRLLASLLNSQADVLCLQELQLERNVSNNEFVLPKWIRPLMEETTYKMHLPPNQELEDIAELNVRVLDKDAAVACALLYRADRLIPVPTALDKKNKGWRHHFWCIALS